jgi:hypothetical protein
MTKFGFKSRFSKVSAPSARPEADFLAYELTAEPAGCEAFYAEQPADEIPIHPTPALLIYTFYNTV